MQKTYRADRQEGKEAFEVQPGGSCQPVWHSILPPLVGTSGFPSSREEELLFVDRVRFSLAGFCFPRTFRLEEGLCVVGLCLPRFGRRVDCWACQLSFYSLGGAQILEGGIN